MRSELKWLPLGVLVTLCVVALIILQAVAQSKKNDAITSSWNGADLLKDGREYEWYAGGQSGYRKDTYRILVIGYYATPGRERLVSSTGRFPDLRGSARIDSCYPPDEKASGLIVNGVKQPLNPGLNVVLVSNVADPQSFTVPANQASRLMHELRYRDWDDFFNTFIRPRLAEWKTEAVLPEAGQPVD